MMPIDPSVPIWFTDPPTGVSRKSVPLALFLVSMSMIVAVWYWLASAGAAGSCADRSRQEAGLRVLRAVPERADAVEFRHRHQPGADCGRSRQLAGVSNCIRTYSVENGLDKVPELASKVGLKVILGIWLGRDRVKNAALIDTAVSLAKEYRGP